ncbi:protein-ER retention protein [Diatrype stigma]|uniref:Protein-ER retention protein n=1 Tax=Diatrype stigma TaxID=117547 RepID=A0AAN9YI33_9PEZI
MDGDPAVEPELDSFSLTFPLPYRVAFIVVLAVWAWGANLQYLHLVKIDVPALIRYPGRSSPHHPPHHLSTYRFATVLSALLAFALLLFWVFTHRDPVLVVAWDWLPVTYLGLLLALLLAPLPLPLPGAFFSGRHHGSYNYNGHGHSLSHDLSGAGRSRLRSMLRRIAVGGIAEAKDGKFGDILLADVLTSYAKVLADLYVALCMFLRPDERGDGGATARPDRACGGTLVVPLVLVAPSAIRLRQCLIEYGRARRGGAGGGQHLANALKYASAFPVIIFATLQRNHAQPADGGADAHGSQEEARSYFRLWVAACVVNSLYSFYWDVAKDWDLTLFDGQALRSALSHPFGLRRRLHVGPPALYYAVIAMDLLLRCTPWAVKLSGRLGRYADAEGALFALEFLEVFRRWVWIFFRVETEWIRSTTIPPGGGPSLLSSSSGGAGGGGGLLGTIEENSVLLSDFEGGDLGKYEDED